MIQSILLHNFQSHEHSLFSFCPGVNVIVGPSDSGKTSMVRALNWVISNRPVGNDYCRYGSHSTRAVVKMEGEDGGVHTISRIRSDDANLYQIDGTIFSSLGMDVPEAVGGVLRMGEGNIQNQMDPPFLLSLSPGEVARTLNQVVGLNLIDVTLSGIARYHREVVDRIKVEEGNIKGLEERLKEYEGLEEIEKKIEEMEAIEIQMNELLVQAEVIVSLIEEVEKLEREAKNIAGVLEIKEEVMRAEALKEEFDRMDREGLILLGYIQRWENMKKELSSLNEFIKVEGFKYKRMRPKDCPLCGQQWKGGKHDDSGYN